MQPFRPRAILPVRNGFAPCATLSEKVMGLAPRWNFAGSFACSTSPFATSDDFVTTRFGSRLADAAHKALTRQSIEFSHVSTSVRTLSLARP